jgi:hypothetical protein
VVASWVVDVEASVVVVVVASVVAVVAWVVVVVASLVVAWLVVASLVAVEDDGSVDVDDVWDASVCVDAEVEVEESVSPALDPERLRISVPIVPTPNRATSPARNRRRVL